MITVEAALAHLFALVRPLEVETCPIAEAAGRVLARPVAATRDQPPFLASAMDGYAVAREAARPGAQFRVIGRSVAGRAFSGTVGPGEAVRILTGAPVPDGASRIIIQEDVTTDGETITLGDALDEALYIRAAGNDFSVGTEVSAPRRLSPEDLVLLAAMNVPEVPVYRRPSVAVIATGDELVLPGEVPGPDQIIASNGIGLRALCATESAETRLLPVARDTEASLLTAFSLAEGADLIVTIGGASVGDHDLVGQVAEELGMDRAFYKVAMRPGKPLMAGTLRGSAMVGLPGNPVSSMVCGHVFLRPLLRAMQGLPPQPMPRRTIALSDPLPKNGPREHYMRARIGPDGAAADPRQDSALTSVLAAADILIVRPPNDPPREAGETVEIIDLR
jgi:molybdopterin molybdotransferase